MADEKDILFTASNAKTTIKKSRSYGSTSKSVTTTAPKTLNHKVRPNDTLVSLAIKYETSVEELKRLNSLWSNDSLQLKASIKVPATSAAAAAAATAGPASREPTPTEPVSLEQFVSEDAGETTEESQQQLQQKLHSAAASTSASGRHGKAAGGGGGHVSRSKTFSGDRDFSEMKSGEFLRKFDLQFMQLKSNIEKLENESSLSEEDTSAAYSCLPRRSARYMSRQAFRSADQTLEGGPPDALANPELVVRSHQLPEADETFYKL